MDHHVHRAPTSVNEAGAFACMWSPQFRFPALLCIRLARGPDLPAPLRVAPCAWVGDSLAQPWITTRSTGREPRKTVRPARHTRIVPRRLADRTCELCGTVFATRNLVRYCSSTCAGRASHPGNVDRVCIVCDRPFSISRQYDRPTCSRACTRFDRLYPGQKKRHQCERCGKSMDGHPLSARHCSRLCTVASRQVRAGKNKSFRVRPDACLVCGASLEGRMANTKFCSRACQARRGHEYRSAATRNAPVEQVDVGGIFAIWGWHCHICDQPIDPSLKGQHPMMGSVDHLIPIADPDYPGHVWENLAPAHLRCNIRKGTRPSVDTYRSLATLRRLSVEEDAWPTPDRAATPSAPS